MFFRMDFVIEGVDVQGQDIVDFPSVGKLSVNVTIGHPSELPPLEGATLEEAQGRAVGQLEPAKGIRAKFEDLAQDRLPPGSRPPSDGWQYADPNGQIKAGVLVPLAHLPEAMESFLKDVENALLVAATDAAELLRWRYGLPTPHRLVSRYFLFWSFDGRSWKQMAKSGFLPLASAPPLRITKAVREEAARLYADGVRAPMVRAMLLEAWEQRHDHPRSAVLIGLAAAEVGCKQCVTTLATDTTWLIEHLPSPPLVSLVWDYLPELDHRFPLQPPAVMPPKKADGKPTGKLYDALMKGVKLRNEVAHTRAKPLKTTTVEDILRSVSDLLWIFDYYCGHAWALVHVRDGTRLEWAP